MEGGNDDSYRNAYFEMVTSLLFFVSRACPYFS